MALRSEPSCSVVLAARDAADTLPTTLASLRRQTQPGLRLHIIDDASTDRTPDIIERFVHEHPSADWVRNPAPIGAGASRNLLLARVDTEYVGFIDADDWVHPAFYGALVSQAAAVGAEFLKCCHVLTENNERRIRYAPVPGYDRWLPAEAAFGPISHSSMVDFPWTWSGLYRVGFLREHGLRFDAALATAEDRLMTWRMHRAVRRFYVSSEHRYFYRRGRAVSLTQVGDIRQLDIFTALQSIFAELDASDAPLLQRAKAYRQAFAMAEYHYTNRARLAPEVRADLLPRIHSVLSQTDRLVVERSTEGLSAKRLRIFAALREGKAPDNDLADRDGRTP